MEALRKLRKEKGFKQKEIANYLKISIQAYSGYESGYREPDFATIVKLADFFNVSVDYLLERDKAKNEPINDNDVILIARGGKKTQYTLTEDEAQAFLKILEGLKNK